MSDDTTTIDDGSDEEKLLDMDAVNADIAAGAKAFSHLLSKASDDWTSWAITIRGLRGLRDIALAKAHTRDIKSWHYRHELGALLQLRKHSIYDRIDKQTRSSCYKLMDRLDEISDWYTSLAPTDQMRWKHPDSIAKHCPKHLLSDGLRGHNKPKQKAEKKPVTSAEIERLKALLLQVIKRLIKYEPDARDLLDQITPQDPNDGLDGILGGPPDSVTVEEA